MSQNGSSKSVRVGATAIKILNSNEFRKKLLIQLKTASKKLSVKLNSTFNSAVTQIQTVAFSAVPTVGSYKLNYGGNATAAIAWDDNAAAVQAALRLVSGLSGVTVAGDTTTGFVVTMTSVYDLNGKPGAITASNYGTLLATATPVIPSVSTTTEGSLADGIDLSPDIVYDLGAASGEVWAKSSDSTVLTVDILEAV